jgi:hypothetical protein
MKVALAQYPIMAGVEVRPARKVSTKTRTVSRAQVMAYVTKAVVVVACLGMTYALINYGRIFQNYTQW